MRIMQRCFFKIIYEIRPAIPKFKDKLKAKVDIFQGYIYGSLNIIQGFIPGNHINFPCFTYNSNVILEIYSRQTEFIGGFFHNKITHIDALNYAFP